MSTFAATRPLATAAEIAARLDRLPTSRHVWRLVLLISLGGLFEVYDLFFTAYVAPGMSQAGLFTDESLGVFSALSGLGVTGVGTFVFATFAGLFVGTMGLGSVADRLGRRKIFTYSLLWYSATTAIMAFQNSGFGIDLWRFVAGIGLGVQYVTMDTYISELMPRRERGRAFAVNQSITFCAIPLVALLSWLLVPHTPFGYGGWHTVVLIGTFGALSTLVFIRHVPESPRWLARQGRIEEAEIITAAIETAVAAEYGHALPLPGPAIEEPESTGSFAEIWEKPYGARTTMLSVFNFFQTIGYYGFAAWVPTLLAAKGIHITTSLQYSFIIAIANPIGPLLGLLIADRMERKWQICCAAVAIGGFGLAFSQQSTTLLLIAFGILVTLGNTWLSFSFHNYQAELFPTRIRARAIGFCYAWSRLSGAFAGLLISLLLNRGGITAVFLFIAFAMAMVVASIGGFGPRTKGRSLEEIAQE